MKYHIFFVSFYTAAAAATYPRDTDSTLYARHPLPNLEGRGIIRAQHAATKPSQKGKSPVQKTVRFEEPLQTELGRQSAQAKEGSPSQRSQSPKKPHPSSNHPRVSLEAEGPASMTMVRGSRPADFEHNPDTSTRRLSGEDPEQVVGMARSNANPTNTRSQTLRASAYGKGISARVMTLGSGTESGSGSIRVESDHGTQTVNVPSGGSRALFASSDHPRGAKVMAKSTPPGLVSVHAGKERNVGDP